MKILMVNKFLYPRGGAETYMLRIGEQLRRMGHQVEYFGMFDEQNTVANSAGQYTFHMDFRGKSPARLLYPFQIIYSLEAKRKIERVLDAFRPDVVHMNNINFQLTPSIIDPVKDRGIPLVQTVHDYQMICPNHLLYNLREANTCQRCIRGSKWNCAKYGCIHGSRIKSVIGSLEAVFYRWRGTYKKVDRYICPSRFLEAKLQESSDLYRGKTEVLQNFIELPAQVPEQVAPSGDPYVVFAGRLDREKGVYLLAEAAKLASEVRFVVAGRGAAEEALRGLPNVELAGFLTGGELQKLMARAQAAVVPSIWFENCPLSILEAQTLGTPVITMNMGGMAELVEDGVTGTLVPEPTPEALAGAIRRTLSDPEHLAQMARNCVNGRKNLMTLDRYCGRLVQLYHGLAEGAV